jgi:hypothetical protein
MAAVVVRRRGRVPRRVGDDLDVNPGAEDLRRKLAEARESAADEGEFEAAGMGPETLIEDDEEVVEARKRVHDEARATAEEMRRSGDASPEDGDAAS